MRQKNRMHVCLSAGPVCERRLFAGNKLWYFVFEVRPCGCPSLPFHNRRLSCFFLLQRCSSAEQSSWLNEPLQLRASQCVKSRSINRTERFYWVCSQSPTSREALSYTSIQQDQAQVDDLVSLFAFLTRYVPLRFWSSSSFIDRWSQSCRDSGIIIFWTPVNVCQRSNVCLSPL